MNKGEYNADAENAGHENTAQGYAAKTPKVQNVRHNHAVQSCKGWKIRDMKMRETQRMESRFV